MRNKTLTLTLAAIHDAAVVTKSQSEPLPCIKNNYTAVKIVLTILFLAITLVVYPQTEKVQTENEAPNFKDLFNAKMHPGVSCYRIPSIITAPNGDLVAAIDERVPSCGDLKLNKDINIVIRRSVDNGDSWSEIETVVDYPFGKSASDPSMMVDKVTGAIFLFFNFMDLDNEKDVYYLKVVKSIDNGQTWSSPIDITSQITKSDWHNDFKFITSGRGIQARSDKLLHTLVDLKNGLHLFGSDDHGESWYLVDTPIIPGDESKIVELIDGTWMINSRVNGKGIRFVHTSTDEGATWLSRPDSSLIDPGCNASIIRYTSIKDGADKNRILFSNAKMKDERSNMTIRISYDEGKSWTEGKTIYHGGSAYSSMSILANGDIGLFFEKDNYQENVFVRLPLEWLTDGNDKYTIPQPK
jgi:sialidase-1